MLGEGRGRGAVSQKPKLIQLNFGHFKGYRASQSLRNVGSDIKYAREEGLLARDLLSLVFALFMQTT